jgi:hypothetical protein
MNNVFDYFFVNILDIFKSQYVILDSLLIWIWRAEMILYLFAFLVILLIFEDFLKVPNFMDKPFNFININKIKGLFKNNKAL